MFSSLNSQSQPAAQSSFGQSAFGGAGASNAFGQSNMSQSQAQQPQQPVLGASLGLGQSQNPQLGSSFWQPTEQPQTKPVVEQIAAVTNQWNPQHRDCSFKEYLYNKVDEHAVPLYRPGPADDPKQWEDALQKKPAPNYIPVLAAGFGALEQRLLLQRRVLREFNSKLHEINACLDLILSRHDLDHTVRALNARRRHELLRKRCLVLASRVQVMRNRGFQLGGDEDELRAKMERLERRMQDPAVGARMEELWSRMIMLRGVASQLQIELDKHGAKESEGLGDEVEAKAKKILEDYDKQLQHLKKEVDQIMKDFEEWEKDHKPEPAPK